MGWWRTVRDRRCQATIARSMRRYFIEAWSQLTFGFMSAKVPCGLAFQAQTCSS
jgi:hypothetical protein